MSLTTSNIWVHEGFHLQELRTRLGLRHLDQLFQRKSGPRHSHRPCFNTAMTVKAFFNWQLPDQILRIQFHRLADHAVDLDGPWLDRKILRPLPNIFVGPKFVEIIVGQSISRLGQSSIKLISFIAHRRIKLRRDIWRHIIFRFGRERRPGNDSGQHACATTQQLPPVQENAFRRGVSLGHCPAGGATN